MNEQRKPPRKRANHQVTDADYELAIQHQDAVLFAQADERRTLGRIRTRLSLGARDAGVKYYFDEARGIVRRRENREVGL
jgi:hypothetical protein